jgi:hypothetical protein
VSRSIPADAGNDEIERMSSESNSRSNRRRRDDDDVSPSHRLIVRVGKLPQRLGVGRTAVAELFASGALPKPFPLTIGGRAKAIFDDEAEAYLQRQASEARKVKRETLEASAGREDKA